ncbi:MAG: riboflavin synthase [Gammaproteobacteria bacterium]|jgi:riboflavin synthase|nr:riboflavin synthase [Gammaproteobacteria bacterium]MBT5643532.1 riboflavin synthase [Gammaproteobacteria bacterium]MBT5863661.1 riboflavin synthase [Gammaproteobacteria bacterium]MBT6733963.1 riboflavin synthase [Gammaproteobacteria bacterium]MBT7236423.1 riboflavin synthase [Gammaproteobacteria bacterium]|tara:strand:- start:2509 stop:3096 length:588 start_codon:yes stop_codon:yes gene_type:complete
MFTGIVENIGKIVSIDEVKQGYVISIEILGLSINISNGDSVAVNGACLTVIEHHNNIFSFNLSPETLKLTSLKSLNKNSLVNIEFPLTLNKFISGHITTGHVDTVGIIVNILQKIDSWFLQIKINQIYFKYIVQKGSICIDGVSLTINNVDDDMIDLMIIPHTYENTIINGYEIGDNVNIEVDYIAKHLEKLKND